MTSAHIHFSTMNIKVSFSWPKYTLIVSEESATLRIS